MERRTHSKVGFTRGLHVRIALAMIFVCTSQPLFAKAVVFWQEGFPTVASQPISRAALAQALAGMEPLFADLDQLRDPSTLADADLLVLPYGSATPVDAWGAIQGFLERGGNLLLLGGEPFHVPVRESHGTFLEQLPQDTYAREFGLSHIYEVPAPENATFAWKHGYTFLSAVKVRGRRFFAVQGSLDGLGYMVAADGTEVAAPVVVVNRARTSRTGSSSRGSRVVMLDFEPEAGYWESADGIALVRQAAQYARQGAIRFSLELLFSLVKPGEPPEITIHLRSGEQSESSQAADVSVEILSGEKVLYAARIPCSGDQVDAEVPFHRTLPPGFYAVRGVYERGGRPQEFYQNGFWVEDSSLLASGPVFGVHGDFLTRDGKPFLPFGTNYFTTEANGWDFSGPRNAWLWERDFSQMEKHGVSIVRTGVWMPNERFIDAASGGANERFLRNVEAYLLCARRHNILVNFNFFAFAPQSGNRGVFGPRKASAVTRPPANPYTDPAMVRAERDYVLSIVNRFKDLPWLSWDLINEPSFSNPLKIFQENTPNGDRTELGAWRLWLRKKYGTLEALGTAWSQVPEQLGSFDAIPLPREADLTLSQVGDANRVRALDYNLFAQDTFAQWVHGMVLAIRGAGSTQLVDVGNDEGGVTDRLLNQFYASAGVSFTTNHPYWHEDALLWDSVAAKHPGTPNISGETGVEPVLAPDGSSRYDEFTDFPLLERKLALGFAAGSSGAIQWDWSRNESYLGMLRNDGSAKTWEPAMREMGAFARDAAPSATGLILPQVALVLPQSFQLSVLNEFALKAQQNAVRALYQYARGEAYAVGEYQIGLLGSPKLIILPSAFVLTSEAWDAIADKVKSGATLLISGPFEEDAHFHPTGRQKAAGLPYSDAPLTIRDQSIDWPQGKLRLTYSGDTTKYLYRAVLAGGKQWAEVSLGKGKILFSALPLELNDNLQSLGEVYRYAMRAAGVTPAYTTDLEDPGILICPTEFPGATLYVLTSESNQQEVSFRDGRSERPFSGELAPGRAALLLVGDDGKELAAYNWKDR